MSPGSPCSGVDADLFPVSSVLGGKASLEVPSSVSLTGPVLAHHRTNHESSAGHLWHDRDAWDGSQTPASCSTDENSYRQRLLTFIEHLLHAGIVLTLWTLPLPR